MKPLPVHDLPGSQRSFSPARRGRFAAAALGAVSSLAVSAAIAAPAHAAYSYTVSAGETLSSIAAANGYDATALASYNGISTESLLIEGQTLLVPSADEVAAAGIGGTTTATATSATTGTATTASTEPPPAAPASWLAPVETWEGTAYLDAGVAASWEAMRQDAIANYGVDLAPAGTLSAYRSSEQQAYLYDLFLSGVGAPANPPGSSAHERGVAVDVASEDMAAVIDEIGANYGFVRTIEDEWWHYEWVG